MNRGWYLCCLQSLCEGQRELGRGLLWETYTYPSPSSTVVLGLIFIQSHGGKMHPSPYIDAHLSEAQFKINAIFKKF